MFIIDTICSAGCSIRSCAVTHRLLQCTVCKFSGICWRLVADQHWQCKLCQVGQDWPYNWFHTWRFSLAASYSASTFQSLYVVFKAILGLAPNYIIEFIVRSTVVPQRRDLRSSAAFQRIPTSHRRQFAEGAFAVPGPMLWNTLPSSVLDTTTLSAF